LDEAKEIVNGARNRDYGHPADNHGFTAALWTSYLIRQEVLGEISAQDVCILNILQKISRGCNSMTRDTLVDIAGYAANIEMMQNRQAETEKPRIWYDDNDKGWYLGFTQPDGLISGPFKSEKEARERFDASNS
jgi:hypothetical protein